MLPRQYLAADKKNGQRVKDCGGELASDVWLERSKYGQRIRLCILGLRKNYEQGE